MRKLLPFLCLLLWASAASGQTTVVKLCTSVGSGCDALPTMANLNAAIVTAAALVTPTNIYIQNGASLTGTIVKRHRAPGNTGLITIRSGVDSAGTLTSAGIWPDATDRLWPPSYTGVTNESGHATNYTGALAKIISSDTNEPAVRTELPSECGAAPNCVAHHYKLELLDISCPVLPDVADTCVTLGSQATSGSVPGGNTQNTAAEEPHNLTLSQVYIHGTDAGGAIHCVMVAARDVTIQHSYVSNCWWNGSDAQAIWWVNTTGGFTLTNNYLEGSGEVFMSYGDDPRMNFTQTGITLSASSTTSATLTAPLPDYMRTSDCVSILVGGVKQRACISAIDGPRTGITFATALSGSPNVPGMMRGGVVSRGLTVTGNWFNTPLAWRDVKGLRKNSFELKAARNVTITGNLFTNTWEHGQNGYAIVLTPVNQTPDSYNDSTQIANVLFSYNRVQKAAGCINMSGIDANNVFSQLTENITFSHLSCEDLSQNTYGTGGDNFFPAIGVGTGRVPQRAMPANLTFDHVLIDSRANNKVFAFSSDASTAPQLAAMLKATNFTLKNSIIRNPTSGPPLLFNYSDDGGGYNSGTDSWDVVVGSGAGICQNNAIAGEFSSQWAFCTSALFPTNAQAGNALVNDGTDYSVDQGCGSPSATCYDNAATDGSDLGPNWAILLDYYNDALNGTAGGGETPPEPEPTPPGVIEELTIDNISTLTARNLLLIPSSDIVLNPTGKDVLPGAGYDINIGRNTRKFLTGHFAEIWSSLLVALDVMSTIGGRVMVAPTTVLTSDLGAGDTSIAVKHNNLNNGDRLYLEGQGLVEFMGVTSAASGSGPFTYTVNRSLDPTGPNDWSAGDAVVNTGTTGNGFIDLYSVRGAHAATEIGPSIVFNQRTGTGYNAWEPRAAIGNLDGLYGFSGSTYGMAAGVPGGARFTLTPATGLTIYGGDNDPKVTIDAVGNATFDGMITVGTGRNQIRNSECRVSTADWLVYISHGLGTLLSFGQPFFRLNNEPNTCFALVTGTPGAGSVTNLYNALFYPVTTGLRYEASAYVAMHRIPNAAIMILWYDGYDGSAGIVGAATGNACTDASTGGAELHNYCRSSVIGTAPPGAVTARMQVSATHSGTPGAGSDPYLFMVRSYFGEAGPAQERPTPWGAAGLTTINNGLIETEAINARTIAARSITADKIEVDTITSLELGPSSVTAEQLAANAVTAAAIQSGTITGTQIAGGTITTSHLQAGSVTADKIAGGAITGDTIAGGTISGVTITGSTINGVTINGSTINAGSGNEVVLNNSGLTLAGGSGTNNRIKWTGGHEMWGTTGGIYTNGSFSIEDVLVVGGQGSGAVDLSVDDVGVGTSIQFANMPISTGTTVIWETSCGCLKKVSSSSRYKERIRPWFATDAQRLLNVTPIAFDYRGAGAKGVVGLSAEDLYLVAPEAVNLDAQGRPDSIRQDAVNAYLIQIIKELRDEIAALKARTK